MARGSKSKSVVAQNPAQVVTEPQTTTKTQAVQKEPQTTTKVLPEFNAQKLRMLSDGVFRYHCFEVNAIPRELFRTPAAERFGIRKGDVVMLVDTDSVKHVVV